MDLKRLNIEQFKCFQKEQVIDFSRLTLLTGANSSGKTSILYAILGAIQSGGFPLQFSTNGKYVNMGDFREIVYRHVRDSIVKIGFTFKNGIVQDIQTKWIEDKRNKLPRLYELTVTSIYFVVKIKCVNLKYYIDFKYDPEKDPSIKGFTPDAFKTLLKSIDSIIVKAKPESNEDKKEDKKKFTLDKMVEEYGKPINIENLELKALPLNKQTPIAIGGYQLQQVIDQLFSIFDDFDKQINYISSFRLYPDRTYLEKNKPNLKVEKFGDGYLDQIIQWETKKAPEFDELLRIMKELALLESIKSKRMDGGRFEILVKTKKGGLYASLSDVGFGISQFLPIIVADLQLPNNSYLFIAQPEIHLHPSVQSAFGDYISRQIKSTNKKYIIETHSEYLINRIRLAIVREELKESNLNVYFLENSPEDSKIHPITFTKKGQIKNAPKDFFKTYMMDVMEIAINASE